MAIISLLVEFIKTLIQTLAAGSANVFGVTFMAVIVLSVVGLVVTVFRKLIGK